MMFDTKIARLKFNLGTLIDIKAATGKDPLTSLNTNMDTVEMIEFVRAVFEAGCRTNGLPVPEGFNDFTFAELSEIILGFTKAYSVPGEVNPDTQSGQTVVA